MAVIDAQNLSVSYQNRLMNMVMAIDVNPATDEISVVGTEATNEVRFEPVLNGTFLRVNVATFPEGGNSTVRDLNPHLNYNSPTTTQSNREQSIGDPRGIAWNASGNRAFVTGMGSNNVIVTNKNGTRLGKIEVGQGPTGIVLDNSAGVGFVMNKFDGTISIIDLNSLTEAAQVAFDDPTPEVVKNGRPFLYNTHLTSGLGHVSCGSCHVDARANRLAWDLGDPTGLIAQVATASNFNGSATGGQTSVSPMKGPMVTQILQDIMAHPSLHWRGTRGNFQISIQRFKD
ncbi:MAG: YncE family protein [Verrucomicrobiales bacterium]